MSLVPKPNYKTSPIDEMFNRIYGGYPTKEGVAYELIVDAVLKLLNPNEDARYNQFVKGIYSQQKYQIDGVLGNTSIEAKDYSKRGEKVGRPDIQKQGGGLPDQPFQAGIFASATGYTRNAQKYAEGTTINPNAKPIKLYDIRPSNENDEEGRIKTIVLNLDVATLDIRPDSFSFEFSTQNEDIRKFNGERITTIYNLDGSIYKQVGEILGETLKGTDWHSVEMLSGRIELSNKYLLLKDSLIRIEGLKYKIPIVKFRREIRIEGNGNPCVIIKDQDGKVDKLFTDADLRSVAFKDGEVVLQDKTQALS